MSFKPSIEFQEPSEIKRFQEEKMREALDYIASFSPFYKRLFEKEHIDVIRKIGTYGNKRRGIQISNIINNWSIIKKIEPPFLLLFEEVFVKKRKILYQKKENY